MKSSSLYYVVVRCLLLVHLSWCNAEISSLSVLSRRDNRQPIFIPSISASPSRHRLVSVNLSTLRKRRVSTTGINFETSKDISNRRFLPCRKFAASVSPHCKFSTPFDRTTYWPQTLIPCSSIVSRSGSRTDDFDRKN